MGLIVENGLLVTAGILGITHGVEPDHMAGITALTHRAGNPRLSAFVGGCFAFGHTILVVAWIALAHVFFETTSFPPQLEQFGLLSVGIILAVLSLYLGIEGTENILHRHNHDHNHDHSDNSHTHFHEHLSDLIQLGGHSHHNHKHSEHGHKHGVQQYLKIGTIGALFTLSPPVSMIAFISIAMSNSGERLVVGVVIVYMVSIVATMTTIGGGVGSLFQLSKQSGKRFYAISQVVTAVLVLAFAVSLLVDVIPKLRV